MNIEHVALNVPDPRAAAAWYVAHLDMKIVRSGPAPKHMHFVADARGTMLELFDDAADRHLLPQVSEVTFHVALVSTDIDADIDRLVTAGATLLRPVFDAPNGDRLGFVKDPFGLSWQLAQRAVPIVEQI
jgi:glyoxylase I family protein